MSVWVLGPAHMHMSASCEPSLVAGCGGVSDRLRCGLHAGVGIKAGPRQASTLHVYLFLLYLQSWECGDTPARRLGRTLLLQRHGDNHQRRVPASLTAIDTVATAQSRHLRGRLSPGVLCDRLHVFSCSQIERSYSLTVECYELLQPR